LRELQSGISHQRNFFMRPGLLILLLCLNYFSYSQTSLTKEQLNRLADAGKIYGYVKYFHPFLQYKNINWDSAFASNVEAIIKATNKFEYAAALQKMFSVLEDGLTTVAKIPGDDSSYKEQPLTYHVEDSILYMQMNDAPFMTTDEALSNALQKMASVKGAVFDLRRPHDSKYMDMLGNGTYLDWFDGWYKEKVVRPSNRTVSYSGFPHEFCKGCNAVSFKEDVLFTANGGLNRNVPVTIVVSNENDVSLLAVKLQAKGMAKILQEGNTKLLPGSSVYFYIADSLLLQIRTGEAIDTDGSLLFVQPNEKFDKNEGYSGVMAKAKKLLVSDNPHLSGERIHPLPSDPMFTELNDPAYPGTGYRMLAAAKMYSIINHFYASKISMTNDWDSLYTAVIPKFIAASDVLEYWKAAAEFHAGIQDSHGFIAKSNEWFSLRLNPLIQERGAFMPPVFTSLVQNKIMVTGIFNDSVSKTIGLTKGDIILSIDGKDPILMMNEARKYQNAGNKGSQNFYLASFILFGKKGEIKKLRIQDEKGSIKDIMMPTLNEFQGYWLTDKYVSGMFSYNHHPTSKYLPGDILYIDITSGLKDPDIDSIFKTHKKIKGLIVDIRGYPQGAYLQLESIFKDKMRKINPEITYKLVGNIPASSPDVISVDRLGSYIPAEQYKIDYRTRDKVFDLPFKLVVLINGTGQSNGDYIPFINKTILNATLVGSPTAGAMTNFTNYKIPGNIRLWLSYGPIERKGIQPDIFIQPTIKGVQAGKDEVLERAIKFIQTGK
jgi:C-terminal processing protease CtpA/Prc